MATAGIVRDGKTIGATQSLLGAVMIKCFFYLKDRSGSFVGSLGLQYLDTESATVYAVAVAQALRGEHAAHASVVVATDQRGNEIARAPIGRVGEPSTNGRAYAALSFDPPRPQRLYRNASI